MPRKLSQIKKLQNNIINKFFEEFQIKPTNQILNHFKDYLDSVSKLPDGDEHIANFNQLLEGWLKEKYQPDIFTTGGTINTMLSKDGSRLPDKNTQEKLLTDSSHSTRKKVIVYDYALDSSNQTLHTQEQLMKKLGKVAFEDIDSMETVKMQFKKPGKYINIDQIPYHFTFPKPSGPGTVITHGTDTLEENAALSSYMMLPKTLVWTGSWASPDEAGSDAMANIDKAKILANNSLTPIGVYVVIGNEIHLATRLKKINTHPWLSKTNVPYSSPKPWRKEDDPISYFASYNDNPVGYFTRNNEIYFNTKFLEAWEEILIKRFDSYFPLEKVNNLKPAYVEHIVIGKYTPREVLKDLLKRLDSKTERCGAIIEGDINNNQHYEEFVRDILNLNKDKSIFILPTARTKLNTVYKKLNCIPPRQLRIKLSALLGRPDVANNNLMLLLDENLAGEVHDLDMCNYYNLSIPKEFYKKAEFIISFPGLEDIIINDAVKHLKRKLLSEEEKPLLLINGYGDGHIPIGCMNMQERIELGLENVDPELAETLINLIYDSTDSTIEPEFSITNILKHLLIINNGNKELANKQLRNILINSDKVLFAVGQAIDEGIDVFIGSKAEYAIPDHDAYEIGTILKHIGVKTLSIPTKDFLSQYEEN